MLPACCVGLRGHLLIASQKTDDLQMNVYNYTFIVDTDSFCLQHDVKCLFKIGTK